MTLALWLMCTGTRTWQPCLSHHPRVWVGNIGRVARWRLFAVAVCVFQSLGF